MKIKHKMLMELKDLESNTNFIFLLIILNLGSNIKTNIMDMSKFQGLKNLAHNKILPLIHISRMCNSMFLKNKIHNYLMLVTIYITPHVFTLQEI